MESNSKLSAEVKKVAKTNLWMLIFVLLVSAIVLLTLISPFVFALGWFRMFN